MKVHSARDVGLVPSKALGTDVLSARIMTFVRYARCKITTLISMP